MPIADDIKRFYPDDWDEIREDVLERAANRSRTESGHSMPGFGGPCCEWCGRPDGVNVPVVNDLWECRLLPSDPSECEWVEVRDESGGVVSEGPIDTGPTWESRLEMHGTKTVLTIAHLDQDPRGSDPDRLRALCQRCHLTYDARPEQRARRERIYAELRGQQTLFAARL